MFSEEPEVTSRLADLGLTLPGLSRVIAAGAGGYTSTTAFHTSSAPGSYLYFETTAALRRLCVPDGWGADELDGQARTFDPVRLNAIIVQTGDEKTGLVGEDEPTTRHPKGSATSKKVKVNARQLELFTVGRADDAQVDAGGLLTWVLLVAIVDGELRAELSLPERMSDSSRPAGWLERIILPAVSLGGGPGIDVVQPGGPDTDFDVSWTQ
jgi:hypothetical protein